MKVLMEGNGASYAASVPKSLRKRGFERTFQLSANPTRQDNLTNGSNILIITTTGTRKI